MQDPTPPTGDALVARAVDGDAEALEELLRRVGPRVRAALAIAPERRRDLDAADVMQVTYLEAYLRIRGLRARTEAGFATWLRTVAENNLRDAVRGLERRKRAAPGGRVTRGAEGEGARTLLAELATSTTTAGGLAARREAADLLRAAVAKLPRSYREVVERCDLEERDVRAVAAERGSSPGAVHMLRSRAHDRLRELLGFAADSFQDSA
jgi:RNA polymerase sigma factor (sigma-70 family)